MGQAPWDNRAQRAAGRAEAGHSWDTNGPRPDAVAAAPVGGPSVESPSCLLLDCGLEARAGRIDRMGMGLEQRALHCLRPAGANPNRVVAQHREAVDKGAQAVAGVDWPVVLTTLSKTHRSA